MKRRREAKGNRAPMDQNQEQNRIDSKRDVTHWLRIKLISREEIRLLVGKEDGEKENVIIKERVLLPFSTLSFRLS